MRSLSRHEGFGWAEAAIAGLALAAGVFLALGEDTEASMFGLAFLGLAVGWVLGMPRTPLFVLAVAIAVLASALLLGGFGQSRLTSTLAHAIVSALLAWGLSQPVWSRLPDSVAARSGRAVLALVAVVVVLGAGWEVGEQLADRLLGTALSLGLIDTLADLLADGVGALAGSLIAVGLGGRTLREEGSQTSSA